jgi:hypothetical protein
MRILRWTGLMIALAAAAVTTGCGVEYYDSPGYPGRHHARGRSEDRDAVEGTVVRVNHRDHVIVLDSGDGDGDRDGHGRDIRNEIAVSYDDETVVEYQGRDYQPEDLERGDRIQASVDSRGDRPVATHIEVVYDVSSERNRERGGVAPDPQGRPGAPERRDRDEPGVQGEPGAADLRGTIRDVDTDSHSLAVEVAGDDDSEDSSDEPAGVVVVHYDYQTTVQYQGRSYKPEDLEEGDVVQIQLRRGRGGRPVAGQILVLGEGGRVSPSRSISTG